MRRLRVLCCVVWLLVGVAGVATAQPRPSPDEFVPVGDAPPGEQIPAIRLVATAYGFIWVVLLGYVWTVGKRLRSVEAELDQLQRKGQ
jgi:CcmD family protein